MYCEYSIGTSQTGNQLLLQATRFLIAKTKYNILFFHQQHTDFDETNFGVYELPFDVKLLIVFTNS